MTEQKYANIGMNDSVSIKPTDAGWQQIVGNVDRMNDRIRQTPRRLLRISIPESDADGYISGPFWYLMQMFDLSECVIGCDAVFSDLRIIVPPEPQQEAAVSDEAKHAGELSDLLEIAEFNVGFISNPVAVKKVKRAKYAVDEIRRLRAKVNRLIRVHNEQDADGNHIGEHYAATEDLILEEEI